MRAFFYKLSHLFRKPTFRKVDDIRMEEAFTIGGIKYYEFPDLNMFPWQRMLAATQAYNKLTIGIKEEDLRYASKVVSDVLTGDKITLVDLINVKRVHDVVIQRLDQRFRPDELMWNVAAVIFMDDTESPYLYDPVYGAKKIAFWKKHKSVSLFFSQLAVSRLIPFLPSTTVNSQIYSQTMAELTRIEEDISKKTSTNLLAKQKQNLQNSQSKRSVPGTRQN